MIIKNKYFGISYPCFNIFDDLLYKFWKRFLCCRGYHLLDEVLSFAETIDHHLVCDACGLMIYIDHIDTKYVEGDITNEEIED